MTLMHQALYFQFFFFCPFQRDKEYVKRVGRVLLIRQLYDHCSENDVMVHILRTERNTKTA